MLLHYIDERMEKFLLYLQGIADTPLLLDSSAAIEEKLAYLKHKRLSNTELLYLSFCDAQGILYSQEGEKITIRDKDRFQAAVQGRSFISD